jgi:hypothetical protein
MGYISNVSCNIAKESIMQRAGKSIPDDMKKGKTILPACWYDLEKKKMQ